MILLPEITFSRFALYPSVSRGLRIHFHRSVNALPEHHQQTGHFPSKLDLGALSSTVLESPTRSASNVQLMITSQDRQNSLLHRKFQSGRAILKSLRISYTQSRQWTSTDHVTLLKTDHFSSKSRMCALSSTVLESHGLRHLLITPKHSKTPHSTAKMNPSALKSTLLESLDQRPSHLPPMIPSEEGQYTPLRRNIELECALLKTP